MAKGAGIAVIGLFIGNLIAYLIRVFIARTMGPEVFGLLSMGIAIVNVLIIFSLIGIDTGITRYIAFYKGLKAFGKIKGAIDSSIKITIPLSIIISVLLFIFSDSISVFFFKPELAFVLKVFSFFIPFLTMTHISYSIFLGFKLTKYKVLIWDLCKNLTSFIFIILLFYFGCGFWGVTFGFMVGFLFSGILGVYLLKKKINPLFKGTKTVKSGRELIRFSWPLFFTAAFLLFIKWTDVLMLGYFDTAVNVGIYSAILNLGIFLTFLTQAFIFIFTPMISELYSEKKLKEIKNLYRTATRWIFTMVFPIFLLMICFPDEIINIFFGVEFIPGYKALVILSFGYLIASTSRLSFFMITAIGETKVNLNISLITLITNVVLNILLIPIYGMFGAAIAMTVALIINSALSLIYVNRKMKMQPYEKKLLIPFISALLSVGVTYIIINLLFVSITILSLLIGFVIFIPMYVLYIVIYGGLNKEDIVILKALEKKTGINLKKLRWFYERFCRKKH